MKTNQALLGKYPVELKETNSLLLMPTPSEYWLACFKRLNRMKSRLAGVEEPVDVSVLAAHFGGGHVGGGCTISGALEKHN